MNILNLENFDLEDLIPSSECVIHQEFIKVDNEEIKVNKSIIAVTTFLTNNDISIILKVKKLNYLEYIGKDLEEAVKIYNLL